MNSFNLAICKQPGPGVPSVPQKPAVQSSGQQEITLFRGLFVGREDCFYSTDQLTKQSFPITNNVLNDHLQGRRRLGVYQLMRGPGNTTGAFDHVKWLCFDFDNPDNPIQAQKDCEAVGSKLSGWGIQSYTEVSKIKGYHRWAFFYPPVSASDVQRLCRAVVGAANLTTPPEIFPKQTTVDATGFGNLVNLPDFGAYATGKQVILDQNTNTEISRARFLRTAITNSPQDLATALSKISSTGPGTPPSGAPLQAPAVGALFAPQATGNRNNTTFDVARYLKNQGLTETAVLEICKSLNQHYQPPQPPAGVVRTVRSVFANSTANIPVPAPLTAVSALDFMTQNKGIKLTYHIDPLLRTDGSCVIFGKAGVGKSTVAMQIAWELAAGVQSLGRENDMPEQKVLYLDGENGKAVLAARLQLIGATYVGQQAAKNLYVSLADGTFRFDGNYHGAGLTALRALLEEKQPNVLILDSFQNFLGVSENDADKVRPALDALKRSCTRTQTAIILLHHTNKSIEQAGMGSMRGSSTVGDWAESVVQLKKGKNGTLTATTEKCRNGYPPAPVLLTRNPTTGIFTASSAAGPSQARFSSADVVTAYQAVAKLCGKIRVRQPDVVRELIKSGGSDGAARRAIKAAIKRKLIKINKNTNGGSHELFI